MTTVPTNTKPQAFGTTAQSRLMVLMFTDAVGSVELKSRLGNESYSTLIGRHDELFKSIIADIPGASIYKDIGDGFLSGFERASDAVTAALRFQRALRDEPWNPEPIRVRTGIHIGQIAQGVLEETGKPKLIGLAADVAARIMGLGLPGQILLSRSVFDDARQFIRRHPLGEPTAENAATEPALRWVCHGLYRFKGADEPMEIYEVGADPGAPLKPPPAGDKAARVLSGDEELLGWRPAVGLPVPRRTGWTLERRLGEGAIGEAWLAANRTTRERRVFKFCFEAEKVAALRREAKLFRILRDALGARPEIVRVHEAQLESPPYFIETDYAELGSLEEWAKRSDDGFLALPLVDRIEFAARIADAAAAAHSIGIVHKDIKPANILVYRDGTAPPRPRLADFGMAAIRDLSQIVARRVAVGGATLAELDQPGATSDAPNYIPPEVLAGRPHEEPGDVYALGVITFQCAVGDFRRPLTPGWDRLVTDLSLHEVIASAIEHDERTRTSVAGDFA
ncbi:MAG: protein kinase domain-containing protein, partial [Phycisphaerales bacterium]